MDELERAYERMPEVIAAFRAGNRKKARSLCDGLPKKIQKAVASGPVSTIESAHRRISPQLARCRLTLRLADDPDFVATLRAELLSSVPELACPGFPPYEAWRDARLRFRAQPLEANGEDTIELSARAVSGDVVHHYRVEWGSRGFDFAANAIHCDARVPSVLFERAKQAARDYLETEGRWPSQKSTTPSDNARELHFADQTSFELEARMVDGHFDPGTPARWWVLIECPGPRYGGKHQGVWFGQGFDYHFRYDADSGHVLLEERGWVT